MASDSVVEKSILPAVYKKFRDLYSAAKIGDWEETEGFLRNHPCALHEKLSHQGMRLLHVAAEARDAHFMEKLLPFYATKELESIKDEHGKTALHAAAENGNLDAVKILVKRNPALTKIPNNNGSIPILFVAILAPSVKNHKKIISYLADETEDPFVKNNKGNRLLSELTLLGFHDITLQLLKKHPYMILNELNDQEPKKEGAYILNLLPSRPYDFPSGCKLQFWKQWMYKLVPDEPPSSRKGDIEAPVDENVPGEKQPPSKSFAVKQWLKGKAWKLVQTIAPSRSGNIQELKQRHKRAFQLVEFVREKATNFDYDTLKSFQSFVFLNSAATAGVVEIVELWLASFPYPISFIDVDAKGPPSGRTPLYYAVAYRQEKVFNAILKNAATYARGFAMTIGLEKQEENDGGQSDKENGSILHIAASLAPSSRLKTVPGKAFQMQSELQWFQRVQQLVGPVFEDPKQTGRKLAQEVFNSEHKELAEKAEQWMKDTSTSCSVVTALIATVVFAAAFTVPGGNNDQGLPVFNGGIKFNTFIVSDIVALFASLTSLLMFLSILTARYTDDDFAVKLPMKLLLGFAFEFIAVATMMIAFVATLWITLDHKSFWASVLASVAAVIPLVTFLIQQLPMFITTFKSTMRSVVASMDE